MSMTRPAALRAAAPTDTTCLPARCRPPACPVLQEQLQEARIQLLDICGKGDQVAAVRCASLTTKAGTVQPSILVIDVWHVAGGQVRELSRRLRCIALQQLLPQAGGAAAPDCSAPACCFLPATPALLSTPLRLLLLPSADCGGGAGVAAHAGSS